MYDHLDGMHPGVIHHVVGDLGGDSLDQIAGGATDDVGGALGQHAVVERIDEVIAGCSSREVDPDGDVDDEVLAVASLMREHTVVAPYRQAAQLDTVSHQCPLFRAAKHQLL